MNCKFCDRNINNKGSLVKHEKECKLNPDRIPYKSNFIKYNANVKSGLATKSKNQFQHAKDEGRVIDIPPEVRIKLSKGRKGKHLSKEQKENLSIIRSKAIENMGGGGFKHVKWFNLKNISGESFIVRGTWELLVGTKLNEANIEWKRKIYLNYTDDNGLKRTYTPDFYIPILDRYIEVKGFFSEKDKDKLKKVIKEHNINLLILRESDIKDPDNLISIIRGRISSLL